MKLYVVGDIHGCYDLLMEKLEEIQFDFDNDILVSVGDLVDRGPDSEGVIKLLDKPWFKAVMGNHEAMCHPAHAGSYWHIQNGGSWYNELHDEGVDVRTLVKPLLELPLFLEIEKDGKKFGFVHASLNGAKDWEFFKDNAVGNKFDEHPYLWDRWDISDAKKVLNGTAREAIHFNIKNIDHVYMGHTPVSEPMTVGNCTWLDTGAFATSKLTILLVE